MNLDEIKRKSIFYAEAIEKGYNIKVLFDVLADFFGRVEICLSDRGILMVRSDKNMTCGVDLYLWREGFRGYFCQDEPIEIGIDLNLVQKVLKNVKKKESIIMYILNEPDKDNELFFRVTSESAKTKVNTKSETMSIKIQRVVVKSPEFNTVFPVITDYHNPMVIDSNDYQKIKKLPHGGSLSVKIYRDRYLSISDDDQLYSTSLMFGECPDGVSELSEFYQKDFDKSTLRKTAKITGLNEKIFFCAPKDNSNNSKYPLLIKVNVGTYGELKIFIKDDSLIEKTDGDTEDYYSENNAY